MRLLLCVLATFATSSAFAQDAVPAGPIRQADSGGRCPDGDEINAASASLADVEAAKALTSPGDCIIVPADASESWAGDITISGISLIGPGKDARSPLNITAGKVVLDKHTKFTTRLIGIRFTGANEHVYIAGSDTEAIAIVHDSYFYSSGTRIGEIYTNGCLISDSHFDSDSLEGGAFFRQTLGPGAPAEAAWDADPYYGDDDTNGDKNCYFEDNLIQNFRDGFLDVDNGARSVFRHNVMRDASFVVHGGGSGTSGQDTSSVGGRNIQIYDNTLDRYNNNMAFNQWLWLRGSTGVFIDNNMDDASSQRSGIGDPNIGDANNYPNKVELKLSVGCPGNPGYPLRYEVGQDTNLADATPNHPFIISGNTGNGASSRNFLSISGLSGEGITCSAPNDYIRPGRDFVTSNTWGFSKYTYPHPLHPKEKR